jgi:hypothetical protein
MPRCRIHYWIYHPALDYRSHRKDASIFWASYVERTPRPMQFAIQIDRMAARGTSAPIVTPDVNRNLAEVRIRILDRDDHVTFTSHLQLVSGGRVGATEGYETLREALDALSVATRGERPAAAVLERYGRFYGHTLKGRDLEEGLRAPLRHTYLEADERAEVVELRADDRFERVRALVDGDWRHRFRG